MRAIITMMDNAEQEGITVWEDGRKDYWIDGYDKIIVVYPDGRGDRISIRSPNAKRHDQCDYLPRRNMTGAEIAEFKCIKF